MPAFHFWEVTSKALFTIDTKKRFWFRQLFLFYYFISIFLLFFFYLSTFVLFYFILFFFYQWVHMFSVASSLISWWRVSADRVGKVPAFSFDARFSTSDLCGFIPDHLGEVTDLFVFWL